MEMKDSRIAKGYTQETLANKIGVSRATIYNIENGRVYPRRDTAEALANELDMETWEFYK